MRRSLVTLSMAGLSVAILSVATLLSSVAMAAQGPAPSASVGGGVGVCQPQAAGPSPDAAAAPAGSPDTSSPAPIASGSPGRTLRSPAPIRPGQIVFGTGLDPATCAITGQAGPFPTGSTVMFQAWLQPPLTFPTVLLQGTQDGVLWFDVALPIDTTVAGTGPWVTITGTLPAAVVAWPSTLHIAVFDAARQKLAEGDLDLVAPAASPQT